MQIDISIYLLIAEVTPLYILEKYKTAPRKPSKSIISGSQANKYPLGRTAARKPAQQKSVTSPTKELDCALG